MEKKVYNCIIIGATFYGAALALTQPKDSLMIDLGGLVGAEFVDSFHEREPKKVDVQTGLGRAMEKELFSRGLLNQQGEIYLGPAAYVLTDFLKKADIPCLFFTKVITIEMEKDGIFKLEIFNQHGFSELYAKKVIDTTSKGVLHNKILQTNASKTLNIIVNNIGKLTSNILHNSISNLDTFLFPVEVDEHWEGMRQKIEDYWTEESLAERGCIIASIATTFAYTNDCKAFEIEKNHIWKPSTGYYNLLEAFEFGAREEI